MVKSPVPRVLLHLTTKLIVWSQVYARRASVRRRAQRRAFFPLQQPWLPRYGDFGNFSCQMCEDFSLRKSVESEVE